jgi:predicted dehydrogenase
MTIEGKSASAVKRRLRLGMVGGGRGAFIGGVHRMAARLDDRYEFVAGALASDPARARASAADLGLAPDRAYRDFREMAQAEAKRPDGIDVVAIVTPNHVHHAAARAFLDAGIHVICDKPLATNVAEAEDLVQAVERSGLLFALTHNYTGHPMVRHARAMITEDALGAIRVVQVEYPQDWLSTRLEETGHKQAEWRTDPKRSSGAGSLGDIGTHSINIAEFVTGLRLAEIAAELTAFVPQRQLDDNAHLLLRFDRGARGALWTSQVAVGNQNALRLRVYGERAGLEWEQEQPNVLRFARLGEPPQLITRAGPGAGPAAAHATRVPAGHPEGYLEAFAQLYTDFAEQITARLEGRPPDPASLLVPTVQDGLRGMQFIAAALESHRKGGIWMRLGEG